MRNWLSTRRQKGAAAIEFALVFVLFFAVLYGIVSYSLPMLLMQSFNNATAEAVRQSVSIATAPSDPNYKTHVETRARSVLDSQLSWIPAAMSVPNSAITVALDVPTGVLRVSIDYPPERLANVVPRLPFLPALHDLPPVTASIKLY